MVRVLLTGIGGFVGHHVMEHILTRTNWHVVGIDSFRHKGMTDRITDAEHYKEHKDRVTILTHDLRAPISSVLAHQIGEIDYILNLASDSHVDRSITEPVRCIENNCTLVLNMLEYARVAKPRAFLQFSTDEVFGPAPSGYAHHEWDVILPSNPYSASKAVQEAIAISYWRTYGVPLIITNTMNIFGERQDVEKFVPKVINSVINGETIQIHGSPNNIGSRFYLHARNAADALVWLLQHTEPAMYPNAARPDRYNIVGEREINNLEMASLIALYLNRFLQYGFVDFHSARPGHDRRYALNGAKLEACGWEAPVNFEASLEKTVAWYCAHPEWLSNTSLECT